MIEDGAPRKLQSAVLLLLPLHIPDTSLRLARLSQVRAAECEYL